MATDINGNTVVTDNGKTTITPPTDYQSTLQDRFKSSGMTAGQFANSPDSLKNLPYTSEQAFNLLSGNPSPSANTGVVQSTQGIRDAATLVNSGANQVLSNVDAAQNADLQTILNAKPYGETPERKAAMEQLNTMRSGLGIISPDEQAQIEQQAQAAGIPYEQMVREAQQAKQQGLPKAVVGAGERGGFMNTQFAGAAALTPTNGNNFIGAGGELERIQSVYDQNIQNAQGNKQRAIEAARVAATQALRTNKREDLQTAQDMLDRARQADQDAFNLAKEKVDAVSKYTDMQQNKLKFNTDKLNQAALSGTVPDDMKTYFDQQYGTGWTDKYLELQKTINDTATSKGQLENLDKLYNVLTKIPPTEKVTIGGNTYSGLKEDDVTKGVYHGTEIDNNGNVTEFASRLNPTTGKLELINTVHLGNIGKSKADSGSSSDAGVSTNTAQQLLASKGADGFVNTQLYSTALDEAVTKGPKAVGNFLKQFPVETYLNPADPSAKRFINTQSQAYKSTDTSSDNPFG